MNDALPALLHGFFHHWLVEQRNASRHTIFAYRDAWRLFLRFAANRTGRPVAELTLNDLTAGEVIAFLQHVETGRGASIATRNCRLAAVRSFFLFVADREPSAAAQCAEVLRIPSKKKLNELSVTWSRKRWRPFWRSPIKRLCWGNAIMHYWDSSTTPGHAFRRLWTFVQNISTLSHRLTSGSSGRVARNESVPCGPKRQICSGPSCIGNRAVQTNQSFVIDTGGNSAHPAFVFNCANTLNPPAKKSPP
jgi:hypothetical protein